MKIADNVQVQQQMSIKSQDVLVVCKLLCIGDEEWGFAKLAKSLWISVGAAHNAIAHLRAAGLVLERGGEAVVAKKRLFDFLVHGVPATFYAVKSGITRGMATGIGGQTSVSGITTEDATRMVWPTPNGKTSGEGLEPLYATVPKAAAADAKLYELLSLVDAVRAGKAKERRVGADLLERLVLGGDKRDAKEVEAE